MFVDVYELMFIRHSGYIQCIFFTKEIHGILLRIRCHEWLYKKHFAHTFFFSRNCMTYVSDNLQSDAVSFIFIKP